MDHLYSCKGCHKPDEDFPGHYETCDECHGAGYDDCTEKDEQGNYEDCWICGGRGDYIRRLHSIKEHMWARNDAYGIYTGLFCDKCYDDPTKYTYRKDRYHDPAYCGERLSEDY